MNGAGRATAAEGASGFSLDVSVLPGPAAGDDDDEDDESHGDDAGGEDNTSFDPILTDFGSPDPPSRAAAQRNATPMPPARQAIADSDTSGDPLLSFATAMLAEALVSHTSQADPQNLREAMDGVQAQQWREAIVDECQSILDNNTWTLLPRTELPAGRPPHALQVCVQDQAQQRWRRRAPQGPPGGAVKFVCASAHVCLCRCVSLSVVECRHCATVFVLRRCVSSSIVIVRHCVVGT